MNVRHNEKPLELTVNQLIHLRLSAGAFPGLVLALGSALWDPALAQNETVRFSPVVSCCGLKMG